MKKRVPFFIVIMLVLLLSFSLAACDEIGGATVKKPTHLSFENPYISTTPGKPVYLTGENLEPQEGDFDLSKVKLCVEYSDGTRGEPITVTESMLTAESKIEHTSFSKKQTYCVRYTVDGVVVEGTFAVYTKVRTEADYSTITFVTNGGTPNSFTKKVLNGKLYSTYQAFSSDFQQVTRAGYTLLGWVIFPSSFDYKEKTSTEINDMANELDAQNKTYTPTKFPSFGITIDQHTAFCAVWEENTTKVTFNYNFSAFSISPDLYESSGLPASTSDYLAPSSTIKRPTIADNAVDGWKFVGWYTNPELTTVRSFNHQVGDADITLYAKWEKVYHTITYNLVGGILNADDFIVDEDGLLYEKTASSTLLRGKVAKYDSKGNITSVRYNNLSYGTKLNTKDIYRFLAKPNSEIESGHYLYKGEFYDSDATRDDYYYEFLGWYRDSDYKTAYNFRSDSTVEGDLVLYAKWAIKTGKANAYYNDYLFKDKFIVKPDGTIKITGINDLNVTEIDLPNDINGKSITEIGEEAFVGCTLLKSFNIYYNSYLTTIGARAFRFCSKLEKFDIIKLNGDREDVSAFAGLKVTSVGKDAFRGTTWISSKSGTTSGPMASVIIGDVLVKYNGSKNVKMIVKSLEGLSDEQKLTAEYYGSTLDGVKTICADAFSGLSELVYIEIPDVVTKIENYAFAKCSSLANIVVKKISEGGKLTDVGEAAFSDTAWFKNPSQADENYTLYNALILGGIYYRFAGARDENINTATIPAGISIIAPDAFQDCDNIRGILFAQKNLITSIGENAFNDTAWYDLQGNLNNGFVMVNGILIGYIGRGEDVLSADGGSIINVVHIPEKDADGALVTKIAINAFYGYYANRINAISMPESIVEIEPYAFRGTTAIKVLTYLGSAIPHDFDGVTGVVNKLPRIYDSSFYGTTSGVLVNKALTLYLSNNKETGLSLYEEATNSSIEYDLYYKLFREDANFIKTLGNNGIRVKMGTLPSRYINSPGWTLSSEWTVNKTFDSDNPNRAMIVIMRTDGLPYEIPLEKAYIVFETIKSTLTTTMPHKLTIIYPGLEESPCYFEYYVEPKIASIAIDNGASEDSWMSQAKYFINSKRFVYTGGYIIINYVDQGVASDRLRLDDIVGADKPVQITNFLVTRADDFELKFTYKKGLQSVSCNYGYTVNEPKDISLEFYEPVSVDIDDAVNLSKVLVRIIGNDFVNGGQEFDEGATHNSYIVAMSNAKVRIVSIDGIATDKFNTSIAGIHTIGLKYGSDALGYTEVVEQTYEVRLKTLDSWFTFNVLTTTDEVLEVVDEVTIYKGTASISGILQDHLPTIVIPEYITRVINSKTYRLVIVDIAEYAFEDNSVIIDLYISASLQKIADKAFLNCLNLENVYFNADTALTYIGNRAFGNCTMLTTLILPSTLQEVGTDVFAGSGLVSIDLSKTVMTEISSNMFEYCLSLSNIILPTGLTEVGNGAFYGCTSLSAIDLGENIAFIGSKAFSHCATDTNTLTITIRVATAPVLGTEALGVSSNTLNIKVAAESVISYQTEWSLYASRISAI